MSEDKDTNKLLGYIFSFLLIIGGIIIVIISNN